MREEQLERSRHGWNDNIKTYTKEIICESAD